MSGFRWIEIEHEDRATVVSFVDKRLCDNDVARGCAQELAALGRQVHDAIIVDFAGVDHIQSVVLNALMSLRRKLHGEEKRLRLCGMGPAIAQVFRATRLDQVFDIRSTLDEALHGK